MKIIGRVILLFVFLSVLSACSWRPQSQSYCELYSHLDQPVCCAEMCEDDYFIVFLVAARHLDYTDNKTFFKTLVKHPDGSMNGDVGHAWILLHGLCDGEVIEIEGGHSGELGFVQPKYFDGVMDCIECGYDDPVKYLWATQYDGFFQEGSGGHTPTLAVKVCLTEKQFEEILSFIELYNYREYSITQNQCSTFLAQIGEMINFPIECRMEMDIQQSLEVGGCNLQLWEDPRYSVLDFSTPDVVEKSLMCSLRQGKGEYALDWYLSTHGKSFREKAKDAFHTMRCYPRRVCRFLSL